MDIDYYCVLGLKKTCSKFEILTAFRKIVREFGMEKLNNNDTRRRLVAFEAYDVLSDPFWRKLYDQFGERAIKLGVFVNNELRLKRYSYHGDIFSTYKSVYGSTNPYVHVMTMLSNKKTTFSYIEEPDVEKIPLGLTLYEVFFGALKKIDVPKSDGTRCIINLQIPKGLPANSEIVHKVDDRRIIIFVTNDLPHKRFIRNGQDLTSIHNVSLKDMVFGVQYIIETLDYKRLRVNITQMITSTYQKIIQGEGMPGYGENCDERGNIIMKFNIQLPRYLPADNEVCKTLSSIYN